MAACFATVSLTRQRAMHLPLPAVQKTGMVPRRRMVAHPRSMETKHRRVCILHLRGIRYDL